MPATALTAIAGVGRAGSLGDGGAATEAQLDLASDSLSERSGITVTSDGTIFIADSQNSTIRSVAGQASSEPGIIRSVAGRWAARQNVALADPMGITADRAGNLYIADHGAGAVDVLVAATGRLETLAQVVSPASIAATLDGTKVFVASPETGGVFAIATSTHAITGVAGFPATAAAASSTAPGPSACPSIENGTIVAPRSQAICPAGLAVDGRGNLFVADANAGRILRVDAIASKITVAASGLSTPGDIAFDSKGDLFVSEQGLTRLIELPQLGDPASAISLTTSSVFAAPCPQVNNPFTFCNTPSGGASQQAAFTLTSTSAVTGVTVGFIPATTPGNFTVESNGCTASLGAGQTCQINVAFTPQTTGALTSALSVTDSNPADAATVSLAGTGDNYSLPLASGQQLELTIVQGGTAVFNGQVAPDSVFGQDGESVQLVCPISSTMPSNTSCVIAPCQATITPGMATPFKITFVTSSATSVAPVPPQSTGCTSYGPPPTSLVAPEPRSREPLDGGQFPPPLLLATFAAIALFLGRLSATTGESTGRKGLPFTLAIAGFAVAILMGCHHGNSNIIGPATTAGTTTMTVTGKALDANGNSLNTSRAMPQITLDVVAQPTGGGGFP
jgi:sugar lactone lactonase YvrE